MSMRTALIAGVGGLALVCATWGAANAAPVTTTYNKALSTTPFAVSFSGVSGFSFVASDTIFGAGTGAAVTTIGTGKVTTVLGTVGDFFAGATIDQAPTELYTFASYPSATVIPNSIVDDYIGLSLTLSDGAHFGYAEVYGTNLISVGFESVAGVSIATGAVGTPEPSTIALVVTGLAMLSVRRRRSGNEAA